MGFVCDMKLICTKSQYGINLPLNTKIIIDNQEFEVCGLANQEYQNDLIWQWWIVVGDGFICDNSNAIK